MDRSGDYHRMRPDEIERVREHAPVAYVPWGALEWHSYHAPIGLDGTIALGYCRALAWRTGGVVLPPIYLATDTIKPLKGFPHTVEHPASTIATVCGEIIDQLVQESFRVVVIVSGHCGGGHTDALRSAVDRAQERHPAARIRFYPADAPVRDVFPSNHAARGETSLQLYYDPVPVQLSRVPDGAAPNLDQDGVWGDDPRDATVEEGREIERLFVERCAPDIEALLNEVQEARPL